MNFATYVTHTETQRAAIISVYLEVGARSGPPFYVAQGIWEKAWAFIFQITNTPTSERIVPLVPKMYHGDLRAARVVIYSGSNVVRAIYD